MRNNYTAIIDYGVGNLFSLRSSLESLGETVVVTSNLEEIYSASRVILPGVGAFRDAIGKLKQNGLDKTLCEYASSGKPVLGICLGMQMLFDNSLEYGNYKGLGLIPGSVVPLKGVIPTNLKVPHIGWNKLVYYKEDSLYKHIDGDAYAYYVHSFYADTDKQYITAWSEYGIKVTGSVRNGNVFGTQFHPEKSGTDGLLMLKAFCEEGR